MKGAYAVWETQITEKMRRAEWRGFYLGLMVGAAFALAGALFMIRLTGHEPCNNNQRTYSISIPEQ